MSEAWKNFERAVAAYLGGKRQLGKGTEVSDVLADFAIAECKYRKKLPAWITKAFGQIENNSLYKDVPLKIVCLKEGRKRGFYIVIRSDVFEPIYNNYVEGLRRKQDRSRSGTVKTVDSTGGRQGS